MIVIAAIAAPLTSFADVGITLFGGNVIVTQGHAYSEPGYSAFSTVDGDLTSNVSVTGTDTSTLGTHTIGYSVTDSALDSAFASRSITVIGGGSVMPYCSGPMAPGWRVDLPGGGCGGSSIQIMPGTSVFRHGILYTCPEWFPKSGCVVE